MTTTTSNPELAVAAAASRYGPTQPLPSLASRRPLWQGMPAVFVQTTGQPPQAELVAEVCAATGMGVVHQIRVAGAGSRRRRIKKLMEIHRSRGLDPGSVLLDRALYTGQKNRTYAGDHTIDATWAQEQWDAGCRYALVDAGYIPSEDHAALKRTLAQAARIDGNVIAVLPLAKTWFTRDTDALLEAINKAGLPCAVIGESTYDPYDDKHAVRGLVQLVNAAVKVIVMRADQAGIGAVAYGAAACAVGTTTALRHLSPVKSGFVPMKGKSGPAVATYVSPSMLYRTLERINEAASLTADQSQWWECPLPCCQGRLITRIANADEAFRHALHALAAQAAAVLDLEDLQARRKAWSLMCQNAQMMNMQVQGQGMKKWKDPGFLAGWVQAFNTDS